MSSTASPYNFISVVAQPDTEQLKGAAACVPLSAGQMIVGNGTYADGTATGLSVFLVLRQSSTKTFVLAPFGSEDVEYGKWLSKRMYIKAVIWRSEKDPVPEDDELLRRWRVVSEIGEEPQRKDYEMFGKTIADNISKKWAVLNELVVSDKPPPQAATDPHFSVIVDNAGH